MNKRDVSALPGTNFLCSLLLLTALLFAGLPADARSASITARPSPLTPHPSLLVAPPPNWTLNPSDYQFNMNVVLCVRYDGAPDNTLGNQVGVFVGTELRGVGTSVVFAGQTYYFVTVFSNIYTGETLNFRTYYAADDKVYASAETVVFTHHKEASTLDNPICINIDPAADFPPELSPFLAYTTLQNIPFPPIDLTLNLISPDGDPVTWSAMAGPNLTATIVNGILTVTPVSSAWTGTETVTIKVTENTPGQQMATQTIQFTVLPDYGAPVLQPIPNQTIFPGGIFTPFDLDNSLTFNGPCRKFDFDVFPYTGMVADPAWPVVPPVAQAMTIVARPLFADEQLAGPGAKLAAFVNGTLAGSASPTGVSPNISYTIALQNVAAGDISFRFYHAENQFLYEKTTTLVFTPGGSVGSVAAPLDIQLSPLVPTLAPDGSVQVIVADPDWLGTYPVDFIVWDCNYPTQRRDTVRTTFSVLLDNRPHVTSPPAVSFTENACSALYDTEATDPTDAEGSGLTYSLAGGADESKFSIDPATGKLSWAMGFVPDFETPADANTDNQYEVIIRVTNLMSLTDDLTLIVTVTDNLVEAFLPQINGGATAVCLLGSVVLQASGGNAYKWSGGELTTSITVNTTGTYTVTITNNVGCSGSVVVTVTDRPTITATGSSAPVCLGSGISLGSAPVGGSGTYTTFAWVGPNSFTALVEDPAAFPATPAAAGTYTVTVTDDAGCSATATTAITVAGNSAPTITASNNGPQCVGSNLLLRSTPMGGSGTYTQFTWSGPNNYNSATEDPGGFPATLAFVGTFTVTVTDNSGCTATGSTTVQVNPLPTITAASNTPLCIGQTVTLSSTPTGGGGGYTDFAWAGPNFTSTLEDPASFPAVLAASGTYTVTVTDNQGCTATGTTALKVNGLPTITAAVLGPVCADGSLMLGSTPAGGSTPYASFLWGGPNSFSSMLEDPATIPVIPAVAGTYTVTVTDLAGCTATGSVTTAVSPLPSILAMNNGPICAGSNLIVSSTPSGGTTPYSLIQWTGPDAYVASVEDPVAVSTTLASMGIYQVVVTDSKGCTATATTAVTINAKPTITATSNSPVCLGANIDLQSTPVGGSGVYSTFNWTGPSTFSSTQEDPVRSNATVLHTGTYRVTVTDNAGCTATASTSVAVSSNSAPSTTATANTPLCAGQNITLGSSPSGGVTPYAGFMWTGPNGFNVASQNPTPFVATALKAGVYTIKVTDNKGCIGTNSVTVVVNAPVVAPTVNDPLCEGSTVMLRANPSGSTGGYFFDWDGPNAYNSAAENPTSFTANASTVGTYTVTVTDISNCTSSGTVTVAIQFNDPPTITCPANQEVTASGTCTGTVGDWVSSATNVMDDCTAQNLIQVSQMPVSSTPLSGHDDEETVTLTAFDGTLSTTCTFKVILKDKTPPSITCPADQTVEADEGCAGVVGNRIGLATGVGDNCTAVPVVTQSPAANTVLSGHTDAETVTLTADDGHGNTTPCTFKVTLRDVTPPTITCPADQTWAADENCSHPVGAWNPLSVSDNCPADLTVAQSPVATTMLVGHNDFEIVTLTANDGHGNTTPCSFRVTLKDITLPVITCPANIFKVNDLNLCSAVTTYTVTATDNCGASVAWVSGLGSGEAFPVGVNTVEWKATDVAGNTATCSFTVTVTDTQKPSISCPPNEVRSTDPGQCTAVVQYPNPVFSDNCAGANLVLTSGLPSGSAFPKGTTSLNWQATDAVGQSAICNFIVTVNDTQAPGITCPANIVKNTDVGLCSAVTTYTTPVVTDNCPGASGALLPPSLPNGSTFPKGVTPVIWQATDAAGLTTRCTFTVTVTDNQRPVATCPSNQILSTAPNLCTAPVSYTTPTFTDNCPGGNMVIQSGLPSGSNFPKGLTTVVWRATDAVGLTRTCTFRVTVNDTQLPTLNCPASQSINVAPGLCNSSPFIYSVTATDNCTPPAPSLLKVNGLASGSVFPKGANVVTWRATDGSGNSVTCVFTITVVDNIAPVITCPGNISVTAAPGQCSTVVTYTNPTATDNCAIMSNYLLSGLASGSIFPQGPTVNVWRAEDNSGMTKTCAFTVTVACGTAPETMNEERGTKTEQSASEASFTLVPNPATEWVTVTMSGLGEQGGDLLLFDPLGRMVLRQVVASGQVSALLDLSAAGGLPHGLYQVRLRTARGTVTKGLVVSRL